MNPISTLVLLSTFAGSRSAPVPSGRLPIINDDYARASAEATQRHVPIFVEVWAPW